MSPSQLHILQHSLGVDQYGRGNQYRNHFVTGPGCDNWSDCESLWKQGLMKHHGPKVLCGSNHLFTVTKAGVERMLAESLKQPKMTRGQKRYHEWLRVADAVGSFGDYLKRNKQP